ncbi:E3 ubiquitin-protein ligase RNF10-like isoform X1 [Asterias amurensis]|uniref:E3 ubiquitin-protein ligase RNF10-like isoform X1 n=1 Tax=Asterias amurensis TaxID=7602 RepID=UPI003AB1431D
MLEEKEMDKSVITNRSASAAAKNPSEPSKKDNGRGNGNGQGYNKKRDVQFSKGAQDPSPQRRSNPQRSKGFADKRPRNHNNWSGRRDEVTQAQSAEFGSALTHGPKKMNLTHLINFTMAPRDGASDYTTPGGWRGRNKWTQRYPRYNKEQFLQANCQFVVKAGCDYSIHCKNADKLVDWDLIEQVRILGQEVPSCPICLYPPTAAKITRCGHIYCWTCVLHYLALGDRTWRKCPICYEAVHEKDLKSVVAKATHGYSQGDEITFRLMKREKGSVVTQPHTTREYGKLFTIEDDPSSTCMVKLLLATPEQVKEMIIEPERAALLTQIQENDGDLEDSFPLAALEMIKEREQSIHNVKKIQKLSSAVVGLNLQDDQEQEKHHEEAYSGLSPPCNNYKHYSSAFSDEEHDPEEHNAGRHSPILQGFTIEEPFQDYSTSRNAKRTPSKTEHQLPSVNGSDAAGTPVQAEGQLQDSTDESVVKGVVEGVVEGVSKDDEEVGRESPVPTRQRREKLEGASASAERSEGKGHVYYFYQAVDGQHLYLQSLNVSCLIREYGSFAQCPETITAKVVEIEHMSMNEALRHRLRYLFHLPLTCEFGICELEFKPPVVSRETIQHFAGDFQKRKKARERKVRNEKKQERKMQIRENKKNGKYPTPKFSLQSNTQFPTFGLDSMPADVSHAVSSERSSAVASPESTVSSLGSPTELSQEEAGYGAGSQYGHDVDSTGGPSPIVGSWASTASMEESSASSRSFAQMLREGKTKPETSSWPKIVKAGSGGTEKTQDEWKIRKPSVRGPDGSDDSSNEDYAPIPQYKDAFSDAIQAALDKAAMEAASRKTDDDITSSPGSGKRGKKGKKKQQLLFSTAGPRFK